MHSNKSRESLAPRIEEALAHLESLAGKTGFLARPRGSHAGLYLSNEPAYRLLDLLRDLYEQHGGRRFTVEFTRLLSEDMEYVRNRPGDLEEQLQAQLAAELFDGTDAPPCELGSVTFVEKDRRDEYTVRGTFLWSGDLESLRDRLQEVYDDNGVAGWFNILRDETE